MEITTEKINDVSEIVTIKLVKADYTGEVEKRFKKLRKEISMPGFRPGQVPVSLLKKRFEKDVRVEAVTKLMTDNLNDYIEKNEIRILGNVLMNEDKPHNLDNTETEEFYCSFDLPLEPKFDIILGKDDVVDYYDVEINEQVVKTRVEKYQRDEGKFKNCETFEADAILRGALCELDEAGNPKEQDIKLSNITLYPKYMKNDEQKVFENCKKGDVIKFSPYKAYNGSKAELMSVLKVELQEVENKKNVLYNFTVNDISVFKNAEINQELFDQIFGKDKIKSEEEFKSRINEDLKHEFADKSEDKFMLDLRKYILDKVGKLEFPDAMLKKIMLRQNKDKDQKWIDENYEKGLRALTWDLCINKLAKAYDVKVSAEDLLTTAKKITKMRFAQYGFSNMDENIIEKYAQQMIKSEEESESLVEHSVETKLDAKIKDVITVNHKTVSEEEFNKMIYS